MSRTRRAEMIDADHPRLSVARQCVLVSISRSFHYYTPKGESALNVQLMRLIDEQYLSTPWYGARQMARHLRRQGYTARRKRIGRLLRLMGLSAIYRKPKTSKPHPAHKLPTCYATCGSIDRITFGAPTSPTSRCNEASSIWW